MTARIHYHTPDNLLPPASFTVEAHLAAIPGGLQVQIRQVFTGREEIPKEEIDAEGFTSEDDFFWEGSLPAIWLKEWEKNLSGESWEPAGSGHRVLIQKESEADWYSPRMEEKWCLFVEEMLQACLEFSGRELPMELVLGRLEKSNFYESARIIWEFSTRSVSLELPRQPLLSRPDPVWKSSKEQVKEWVEMAAEKEDLYQPPKRKGWFWLLNGEVWLPFSSAEKGELWDILIKKVPGLA